MQHTAKKYQTLTAAFDTWFRKIKKTCRIIQAGSLSLTQSESSSVAMLIDYAAHAKSQWICSSHDMDDQLIVKLPWVLWGIELDRDDMD